MRLTEQTNYALQVLSVCALHYPRLLRVTDIADQTGITAFNIFKLLKTIIPAGLAESTRGRYGGVRLAMPPHLLKVGRVVRALEPRFQVCGPAEMIRKKKLKVEAIDQNVSQALGLGLNAFLTRLDSVTIQDLVAGIPREDTSPPRTGRARRPARVTASRPARKRPARSENLQ
jgi:Rrf2 family iron-responsive transcriptional regulator